jgi:glutamine synthetase
VAASTEKLAYIDGKTANRVDLKLLIGNDYVTVYNNETFIRRKPLDIRNSCIILWMLLIERNSVCGCFTVCLQVLLAISGDAHAAEAAVVPNYIRERIFTMADTPQTPKDVKEFLKANDVQIVDFRFTDLPGTMQHFSIPAEVLDEDMFEEGVGFDGSSIRGFQEIHESDMVLVPDPKTIYLDPCLEHNTAAINCIVRDPVTGENYTRDPRGIAIKAEKYLQSLGLGDTAYFGPEPEFYILDDIRYDQTPAHGYYYIDSVEGIWNSGKAEGPNLGYKPRYKGGYFPAPPTDSFQDLRTEMLLRLRESGVQTEVHHHEVGTAGQSEMDIRFDSLTKIADKVQLMKYIIKNTGREFGKVVTFMPKPVFDDNGSGMHVHQSIWQGGKNTFFDTSGYAQLSQNALYYIGGLLKHSAALCALCAPSTNSYRRLVPGFEAPVNLVYSQRNRSAAVRIPLYSKSPGAKRIEYRSPDPSANPYLCFSALLMAGLDGIQNKIDPGEPMDKDMYELPPEEAKNVPVVPGKLEEALDALEADHEFLLRGDVFTPDVISTWLRYKRENEVAPMQLRPHPYEFYLYHDC